MGIVLENIQSYYDYDNEMDMNDYPNQVFDLATKSLGKLINNSILEKPSHIILATSCPDMLSPSLGQKIIHEYNDWLSMSHSIDLVQGCAGGVSALILASQLAELNKSTVLVIQADAAKKAVDKSKEIHKIFGNGSFACIIKYKKNSNPLIHFKSKHYKGLGQVVKVNIGHDSDVIIKREINDMRNAPRKHLGLSLNNQLAVLLFSKAEQFFIDFVKESSMPDILILHQANPMIVNHLQKVFSKYPIQFINVASKIGNCGASTVGIALSLIKNEIEGKKVMLCGYGTGGVINAGLWQF